jgi:hypothetical protein
MSGTHPVPWIERPTIRLDGDLPYARRFLDVPEAAVEDARRLLAAMAAEMPAGVRRLAPLVRIRTANRFHSEAVALADRVGVDWRDVLLANVSYDLVLASFGCTTIALASADGPVLARNMDWWPEDVLARSSYCVRTEKQGRLQFSNAGWPGAIGAVSGLSGRGFAVVLNAVIGPEGADRLGYPVLLHIRRVLEDARDFDDALGRLSRQRLAAPALFTLVGSENRQRVVIERSPTRHALRWAQGDAPLFATNDYRALFKTETHAESEIYRTTCSRYDSLCRMFDGYDADGPVADERLLYVLSDPSIVQGITAQHIILRPRTLGTRLFVPRKFMT